MNLPFYVAHQTLFGKAYECRYFNVREHAELDSPGTGAHIFRATVPE